MNGNMEIDKKPNQEKTIENSEKNILFRFPIFNKTKPYLWLKAVLPENDEYQDIYRIAFNASFFKTLNIFPIDISTNNILKKCTFLK